MLAPSQGVLPHLCLDITLELRRKPFLELVLPDGTKEAVPVVRAVCEPRQQRVRDLRLDHPVLLLIEDLPCLGQAPSHIERVRRGFIS